MRIKPGAQFVRPCRLLSGGHPGNCNLLGLPGIQGGRMTLVFGCRRPDEDHLYREEMLEMAQKRVLHEVHTAYSRLPGQPKVMRGSGVKSTDYTMMGALAPHTPLTSLNFHLLGSKM